MLPPRLHPLHRRLAPSVATEPPENITEPHLATDAKASFADPYARAKATHAATTATASLTRTNGINAAIAGSINVFEPV